MYNIDKITKKLKISKDIIIPINQNVCKISSSNYYKDKNLLIFKKRISKQKEVILVTATSPTPFGEGKTTMSIAISDAFNILKQKSILCLRQPSLGPVFGVKGGAVGGGKSMLFDGDNINLHFTGDFHAITSANNLLASIIDNHIFYGNKLNIDKDNIFLKRCIDINDRSLRSQFVITAASDIMAVLCMSKDIKDLKKRLNQLIVGVSMDGEYIKVKDLNCAEALTILLKDAINPNLTFSKDYNPIIVHGGPFANIGLGCNSISAINLGLNYCDYVVTEAGFGSDLGAEKFINIKTRDFKIPLSKVVIVTTIRSLKYNSTRLDKSDTREDLILGIENLKRHIENIKSFGLEVVVALNVFDKDKQSDIDFLINIFDQDYCKVIPSYPFQLGGEGCIDLVKTLIKENKQTKIKYTYNREDDIKTKIHKVVTKIYKGNNVVYSDMANSKILKFEKDYSHLPICIAKTQYSFTDDASKLGAPSGFNFEVRDIKLNTGADFIIVIAGNIMLMPGLGKDSRYLSMKIDNKGDIKL